MRQHKHESQLLRFAESQGYRYIQQTVEWLKQEYPGSFERMLPQLREAYRRQRKLGNK